MQEKSKLDESIKTLQAQRSMLEVELTTIDQKIQIQAACGPPPKYN
jgi:hypothetical protein